MGELTVVNADVYMDVSKTFALATEILAQWTPKTSTKFQLLESARGLHEDVIQAIRPFPDTTRYPHTLVLFEQHGSVGNISLVLGQVDVAASQFALGFPYMMQCPPTPDCIPFLCNLCHVRFLGGHLEAAVKTFRQVRESSSFETFRESMGRVWTLRANFASMLYMVRKKDEACDVAMPALTASIESADENGVVVLLGVLAHSKIFKEQAVQTLPGWDESLHSSMDA